MDTCIICYNKDETKHFSLYVFGSEGVNLCHSCQIAVCEFIRRMASACSTAHKEGIKIRGQQGKKKVAK